MVRDAYPPAVAFVRRASVVGQPPAQRTGLVVAAAMSHTPAPAQAHPSAAVQAPPSPAGHEPARAAEHETDSRASTVSLGGDGATSVAAVTTGDPAPGGAAQTAGAAPTAAATPTLPASPVAILSGFALVAVGAFVAYQLDRWHRVPTFRVGTQISTFGALFVFAAAVERLLEPLSQWLPGRHSKAEYEQAIADVANRHPQTTLKQVATAKAGLERARADRTVVTWGLATGFAAVIAAAVGVFLLRMLAESPTWDGVPRWVDALVTGLVVGSGTKPLHDLISKVQKGKERAEDPAAH